MRRAARIALAAGALLVLGAAPGWAGDRHHRGHGRNHHHHRHYRYGGPPGVYFGVGPAYGWYGWGGLYPAWGYPPSPVVVYRRPRVVIEEPPVYVERRVAAEPGGWWHYCPSERAYYPDALVCPEGWVRVAPQPDWP